MELNDIYFRIKGFLIREDIINHVSMYVDQTRIVIEAATPIAHIKAEHSQEVVLDPCGVPIPHPDMPDIIVGSSGAATSVAAAGQADVAPVGLLEKTDDGQDGDEDEEEEEGILKDENGIDGIVAEAKRRLKKQKSMIEFHSWEIVKTLKRPADYSPIQNPAQVWAHRMAKSRAKGKVFTAISQATQSWDQLIDIVKSILNQKDIRGQLKDEAVLPSHALTEDSVLGKNVLDNISENLSTFVKKGTDKIERIRARQIITSAIVGDNLKDSRDMNRLSKRLNVASKTMENALKRRKKMADNGFNYKWTMKRKCRLSSKLTTHRQEIINFYLQFSRPADHSRKCKKKVKDSNGTIQIFTEVRRFLQCPEREVYNRFMQVHPEVKIGFITFRKARPWYVIPAKKTPGQPPIPQAAKPPTVEVNFVKAIQAPQQHPTHAIAIQQHQALELKPIMTQTTHSPITTQHQQHQQQHPQLHPHSTVVTLNQQLPPQQQHIQIQHIAIPAQHHTQHHPAPEAACCPHARTVAASGVVRDASASPNVATAVPRRPHGNTATPTAPYRRSTAG